MKRGRLTIEEREKISYYLDQGKSSRELGDLINQDQRSKGSREDVYLPSQAQLLERSRINRCGRKNKIDQNIDPI
jgi:hypothetical protein